jgi:hypothetical protein
VIWFGIALWYAPNHYRGWPVAINPSDMSYIKDYIVVEPSQEETGAIYVFAVSFANKATGQKIYNPKDLLKLDIKPGVPRIYKLPYKKESQKKLQKKKKKGQMMFFQDEGGFKLIDFQKILAKENEENE